MGRIRTCSSRCHNAKGTRCRCWCGGHFHGSQGAGNREALVQAVNEADQALLLQQHGFKEGETRYVQQLQLEKPKPKCPKCGKEIDYLLEWSLEWTPYELRVVNGEDDYRSSDIEPESTDEPSEFVCPECREIIATTHEQARQFLKQK